MKRWILGLLPGALIIAFFGYAWYAFTHAPPTGHSRTTHAARCITRKVPLSLRPTNWRISSPPPATAPLLERETWIMQFAEPHIQREWLAYGRPPLYFSTEPGWSGDYYFEPPGSTRVTPDGITVVYRPLGYAAQHALDLTPWVGKPLHH